VRFDLLAKNSTEFGAFVMSVLKNINPQAYWITNLKHVGQSKWQVLKQAREVGLRVPETYFINHKLDLKKIRHKGAIINKTIQEPYFIDKGRHYFSMYTTDICDEDVNNLPERFMLSCVQTKIEKEYEVRSFFLDNEFFSMAIFSQNDPKTRLDFRNYNTAKPNRVVPYKLPDHIEEKLKTLMRSIDLNCGSIDLIRDKNGEYVFLEVNPNGQYGMVDHPCNYNLNKLIAEKLIYEDQKRQVPSHFNQGPERKTSSALSISQKEQKEIHSI
jgi:ATP-GRASP peptide maturase of grasp-with-spasm system